MFIKDSKQKFWGFGFHTLNHVSKKCKDLFCTNIKTFSKGIKKLVGSLMTLIKLTTDCSRTLRRASRNRASTNSACRLLNDWDTERMLCNVLTSWSRAVMEAADHSCRTTADITSLSFSSTVVTSIWRCKQATMPGLHTRHTQNRSFWIK